MYHFSKSLLTRLFHSGDREGLKKGLLGLLGSDTTEMSNNEKEYYRNNYTKGALRSALIEIYKKIMT